jgi:hypothetical protein
VWCYSESAEVGSRTTIPARFRTSITAFRTEMHETPGFPANPQNAKKKSKKTQSEEGEAPG